MAQLSWATSCSVLRPPKETAETEESQSGAAGAEPVVRRPLEHHHDRPAEQQKLEERLERGDHRTDQEQHAQAADYGEDHPRPVASRAHE